MSLLTLVIVIGLLVAIYFVVPEIYQPPYFKFMGYTILLLGYAVIIIDIIFLLPTVHGAIYLPSSNINIKRFIQLAQPQKNQKAVDIGAGDGRVVVALAEAGLEAHGYEINPLLVLWSKLKYRNSPVKEKLHFHLASMWNINYSQFDIVTIFGMSYIMKDLEKKLQNELPKGAKIICNNFPFPNWKISKQIGNVYLYYKE